MIATDVVTQCSAAAGFNYISLNSDTPHSVASCHLPPGLSNEKPWLRTKLQYTVTVNCVQGAAIVHSITDQSESRRRYKNI